MESDIVERLRAVLHNDRSVELMNSEASAEIERLRAELADAINECEGYLEGNRQTLRALAEANEIAARYKRQRDEARENLRDACEEIATLVNSLSMLSTNKTAEYIAAERGWDCFKQGGGA